MEDGAERGSPLPGNDEVRAMELFSELHTELRAVAGRLMAGQPEGHTLQATALVGEAFLKLKVHTEDRFTDSRHFLCTAAMAMRQILIDHARSKNCGKRDRNRVDHPLDEVVVEDEEGALDLEALGGALDELRDFDPDMARAVDLRYFAGLSVTETARVLELSDRTYGRRWQATRAWLHKRLR